MSIYVILGTPGAFDFEAFSQATRGTLALLASWLELRSSNSSVANEIVTRVSEFVRAIQLGTSAAQCGFTAAEDILTLSKLMQSTTLQERTEYLNGTLELANQAYSQSQEAYLLFRSVRTSIFSLIERFNDIANSNIKGKRPVKDDATRRSTEELRRGIETLNNFETQISALVQWWDWVKVETDLQKKGKSTSVHFDDSSLRQRAVIDRWKLLRTQFADYTNMIGQLEDSYPELLTQPIQLSNTMSDTKSERPRQQKKYFRPDLLGAVNAMKNTHYRQATCCLIS